MHCKNCGFDFGSEITSFCPNCGSQIEFKTSGIKKVKNFLKKHVRAILIVLVAIIVLSSITNSVYSSSCINIVKTGVTKLYPNITYEEAFEQYFDFPKWKYFESEDGEDIVEFQGINKNESETIVQFIVDYEEETSEVWVLLVDGEEMPDLATSLILMSIFEEYEA